LAKSEFMAEHQMCSFIGVYLKTVHGRR
jgi:hypothetical protein